MFSVPLFLCSQLWVLPPQIRRYSTQSSALWAVTLRRAAMALSPCWPIPATHVPGQAVWAIARWAQTTHPPSMYKRRPRHVACSRCSGCMAKIISSLRWAPWTSLCSMWTIKEVSNNRARSARHYEVNFVSLSLSLTCRTRTDHATTEWSHTARHHTRLHIGHVTPVGQVQGARGDLHHATGYRAAQPGTRK